MKKATVIIPVYNAGNNIHHAIGSLLRQTSDDFEVILIDDGSTDNSLDIILDYQNKYPELFRVLTQRNAGVAEARLRGIKEARTEYILFMDNDDFVDDNYIDVHIKAIESYSADIVISGYRRASHNHVFFEIPAYDDVYTRYKILAPWARIFRKKVIVENDVEFLNTPIGEDAFFNMHAYLHTDKIRGIEYIGYNWFMEPSSVSNQKQKGLKRECDPLIFLQATHDLYTEFDAKDDYYSYFIYRYVVWYLLWSGKSASPDRFMEEYERLFGWLRQNNYSMVIFPFDKRIASEKVTNRLAVAIFCLLDKAKLVAPFAKLYCER